MKSHILLIAMLFCRLIATSQNFQWAKGVGAQGNDEGYSIALDGFGNVYTTGTFNDTVDFDPGPGIFNLTSAGFDDIFILKLDASGNFIWAKRIGGKENDDRPSCITIDISGNVYTTGYFMKTADFDPGPGTYNMTSIGVGDIFISKLDPSGNFIWAKSIGGSAHDEGNSIVVDGSKNIYITGQFHGTADFDPGPGVYNLTVVRQASYENTFILMLDSSGNFVWAKNVGGNFWNSGTSIAIDPLGYVYTAGIFLDTVDFDPGPGVFKLVGNVQGSFILKLDRTGNFVWAAGFAGTSGAISSPTSMVLDGFNSILATGIFDGSQDFDPGPGSDTMRCSGTYDAFVLKLDTSGKFKWAGRIGGMGGTIATGVKVDEIGNVYSVGFFQNIVDFDPGIDFFYLIPNGYNDVFISKINSVGKFEWAKNLGGANYSAYGNSIAVDDPGNVYTTGRYRGTADFDPDTGTFNLTSASPTSYYDVFISKLSIYRLGITEPFDQSAISFFPNPVTSRVTVKVTEKFSGSEFIIYDLAGKLMLTGKLNSEETVIDLNHLANGFYLFCIEGIAGQSVKILKQ